MRRSLYGPVTALVMMLTCSAMADAPPPSRPPPTADKDLENRPRQVKDLLKEADAAVRRYDLPRAREIWLQVRELEHSQVAICTLGQLDTRLARWTDAAAELSQCFVEMRLPANAKERMFYEQRRADLVAARRHVAAVTVQVSDPGAEVLVDDRRIGVSPLKLPAFVTAGKHRIVAKLGGTQAEQSITAEEGTEQTVRLVLPAVHVAASSPPAGPRAGSALAPPPPKKPSAWPPRWQTVAILAAPVALGAFGVGALTAANHAAGERDAIAVRIRSENPHDCPDGPGCDAFTAADGRAKTWTAVTVGSFVGAGLAAAGAAVYLFTPLGQVRVKTGGTSVQIAAAF
jgi:hypothetical protein